jgi:hypothetical protein
VDEVIVKLLGLLNQLVEERGVPKQDDLIGKNIITSPNSTLNRGQSKTNKLSSGEKSRLIESVTLFNKLFFDYSKNNQSFENLAPPIASNSKTPKVNKPQEIKASSSLTSSEKRKWIETFTLFNTLFFEFQNKNKIDTKDTTKISKIAPPKLPTNKLQLPSGETESGLGLGILPLISLIALIGGLATDGPLKGIAKIVAKLTSKTLLKSITSVFSAIISPFEILEKTFSKFLPAVKKILGETTGKIGGKILSTKGIGGIFKGLIKFIKPLAKGLAKIPIIGTIISLGFAISRFYDGDITAGVIDVLSALTGLLYLFPPAAPVAFALSMGLDVLNAVLDVKAANPENKGKSKLDILKEMAGPIGKFISDNALYLPIIGGVKRFGMAIDAFKAGNISEGISQLGMGLFSFVGGGIIIKGLEVLSGWLSSSDKSDSKITPDSSWMDRMKGWIASKLKDLPDWLARPLAWFGIIDDNVPDNSKLVVTATKDASLGVQSYVTGVWDNIKNTMGETVATIGNFISKDLTSATKDISSKLQGKYNEAKGWFENSVADLSEKTNNKLNVWIPEINNSIANNVDSAKKAVAGIGDSIGSWANNLFSSNDDKLEQYKNDASKGNKDLERNVSKTNTYLMDSGDVQTQTLRSLHKSSQAQVKLLGELVNVGNDALRELKRISNGERGSSTQSNNSLNNQSSGSGARSVVPNKRSEYLTSPYSIR